MPLTATQLLDDYAPSLAPTGERDRYGELLRSPYVDPVVLANRVYLAAAVADAPGTEQRHWALSCLPTTGRNTRFSTLSMGGQEVFAVFRPDAHGIVDAHVFVSAGLLDSFGADFDEPFLQILPSPYVAGGDDQVRVIGAWDTLTRALGEPPLRAAARDFAERLLPGPTSYGRYHDRGLAGRVLGRR